MSNEIVEVILETILDSINISEVKKSNSIYAQN